LKLVQKGLVERKRKETFLQELGKTVYKMSFTSPQEPFKAITF